MIVTDLVQMMHRTTRFLCSGGKVRRGNHVIRSVVAQMSAKRCMSSGIVEPSSDEPTIPQYQERHGENIEIKRSRLLYQSRKRGMLENDLLLSTFAAKFLDSMTGNQLNEYDSLINKPSNDWEIYYWATGMKPVPAEYDTAVMKLLKEHVENKDMTTRLRQPNLYS